MHQLISLDEAKAKIFAQLKRKSFPKMPVDVFGGYWLGESVTAEIDSPPFDSSAVDGFCVRSQDRALDRFRIVGEIAAGQTQDFEISQGECRRIYTGARVPPDCSIIMLEDTRVADEVMCPVVKIEEGEYIRPRGSDFAAGTQIASEGDYINAPKMATLVSGGVSKIVGFTHLNIAVLTSGNELIKVGQSRDASQIYNSCEAAFRVELRALADTFEHRHVGDNYMAIKRAACELLDKFEVLISVGGMSAGEHDLLRKVYEDIGVEQIFFGVNIRPGKPFYFGIYKDKLVFGLPGNPVSALVTYALLVKPALRYIAGSAIPLPVQAILSKDISRADQRPEFVRGRTSIEKAVFHVVPIESRESHQVKGLADADCLIHLPEGVGRLTKGELVDITMLSWT